MLGDLGLYARSVYEATVQIRDFIEMEVVPVLNSQMKLNDFESTLTDLYFRMVLLSKSLVKLDEPHDFQSVRACARTAFELYLDIHHLVKDPNAVEKMLAFVEVWKFDSAEKSTAFLKEHSEFERPCHRHLRERAEDPELRKERDRLMEKFWDSRSSSPQDWSGQSIRNKARKAGIEFEYEYIQEYGLGSLFVHSGIVAVNGMPIDFFINAYVRGNLLFQKSYLESTALVCKAHFVFEAKPTLEHRLKELEELHEQILSREKAV